MAGQMKISVAVAALLAAGVNAQSATAPIKPNTEKQRCKRFVETGNLAKSVRVCHTVAEWDALQREGRSTTEAYQQPGAPPRID